MADKQDERKQAASEGERASSGPTQFDASGPKGPSGPDASGGAGKGRTAGEESTAGAGEPKPSEVFQQGMSLLWKAARSAADEIKREVEKGGVSDALHHAGRDLEHAATQAGKVLEGFLGRMAPPDPKTSPWPNKPPKDDENAQDGDAKDGDAEDGGTTETGERRDRRIQVDDDG